MLKKFLICQNPNKLGFFSEQNDNLISFKTRLMLKMQKYS